MIWTVATARKRFADFLRAAQNEPQPIERYGDLVGVMISGKLYEEFQAFQLSRSEKSVGASFEELREMQRSHGCDDETGSSTI